MNPAAGDTVMFVQGDRDLGPEWEAADHPGLSGRGREHPAIVTRVYNVHCVNLTVIWDSAYPTPRASIMRDRVAAPGESCWRPLGEPSRAWRCG